MLFSLFTFPAAIFVAAKETQGDNRKRLG